MAQITLRVPDDLLERIEQATDPETSRSEWLRDAARDRLDDDRADLDELAEQFDDLEQRVDRLEQRHEQPLYRRLFA
jgi:metal-responsive CopG/Arc/MetJ family transcriptional regulator